MKKHLRQKRLVLEGSPCDINLYSDGPKTVTEAKKIGPLPCPYLYRCKKELTGDTGLDCIMLRGLEVAKNALKGAHSIDEEMKDFGTFFESYHPKGFVYSADRKEFEIIEDRREIIAKIREFAKIILGGDLKANVGDSFDDVLANALTSEGAIDLRKIEEFEGRFGTNGGRGCDVRRGPCSCGAWH